MTQRLLKDEEASSVIYSEVKEFTIEKMYRKTQHMTQGISEDSDEESQISPTPDFLKKKPKYYVNL